MVGYIAKGLVIAGVGALIIVAASRSEPNTATGLDGALKTLGTQPYGAVLLIAAGLGIITDGPTASPWRDTPKCKHASGGLSLLADPMPRSSPGRRAGPGPHLSGH